MIINFCHVNMSPNIAKCDTLCNNATCMNALMDANDVQIFFVATANFSLQAGP